MDDIAREVKSGPVTLTKYKDQILKDIDIIMTNATNGEIKSIEWHCFDDVDKDTIEKFIKEQMGTKSNLFTIIKY